MAVGRFGVGPRVAVTLAATVVLTAVVTTAGGSFSGSPGPTTTSTTSTSSTSTTDAPRPGIVVRDIRTFDELTDCLSGGSNGLDFSIAASERTELTEVTLAATSDTAFAGACGSVLRFCTTESVTFAEAGGVGGASVPAELDAVGSAAVTLDGVEFDLMPNAASSGEEPQHGPFRLRVRPRSMRLCPVGTPSYPGPDTSATSSTTTTQSTTTGAPSSTSTTTPLTQRRSTSTTTRPTSTTTANQASGSEQAG